MNVNKNTKSKKWEKVKDGVVQGKLKVFKYFSNGEKRPDQLIFLLRIRIDDGEYNKKYKKWK